MRTEKERMLQEGLYRAGNEELREDVRKSRQLTRLFNNTTEEQMDYRQVLLKKMFKATGEDIYIEPPFRCDYGTNTTIGNNFYANFDCVFLDVAPITIGDNCMFGPKVSLLTPGHPIDAVVRNSGLEFGRAITIGDNVWFGGNVVVNPGVTIGDNTIIGSGAVVTKDIPDNVIAAGNPCKVIRAITDEDKRYWEEEQKKYWDEVKGK